MPDPAATDYDPMSLNIDLYGNAVDRNPYFPDPADATLNGDQVLYHLAFGAKPEDFQPALQGLARTYGLLFRTAEPKGPGLLGPLDSVSPATPASPSDQVLDDEDDGNGPDLDTVRVAQAASDGTEVNEGSGAGNDPSIEDAAAKLSDRDRNYLDRYYAAAAKYANPYKVNPALVLGLGIESGFGTQGTYRDTGDAFGMTGGSTANMTTATSPEDNVRKFFANFGERVRGVGDDTDAFINALQGRDAQRKPIRGVKPYNSDRPVEWEKMARDGIDQMRRDLPIYLPMRSAKPSAN